jgi:hypothetical protein
MEKALRLSALAIVVLSSIALALSSGRIVGSTFALFNGETENAASTFAGGWIGAPTGTSAAASGYDMVLNWTPGAHGPITGQTLNGVDNNTNSNCTGAAYTSIVSGPAATNTYTDASRGTVTNNGHWFCYQLVSTTSPSLWTASTAFAAVQLGLVTTGISIANVATNNSVAAGDTITLTFNQPTNKLAGPTTIKVCVVNNGASDTIILGDTTGGSTCANGDANNIGVISGVTIGTTRAYTSSSYTTTSTSPYTMTITIGGAGTSTESGTATFTPSSSILSSATTHQATMCTTATICRPTTTTHF